MHGSRPPTTLRSLVLSSVGILLAASAVCASDVTPSPTPVVSPTPGADTDCVGPIQAPALIKRVEPHYPEALREQGVKGLVVLRGVLGTDGRITNISVLDSPSETLTTLAKDAFRQWRYKPAICDGRPHRVNMTAKITFYDK